MCGSQRSTPSRKPRSLLLGIFQDRGVGPSIHELRPVGEEIVLGKPVEVEFAFAETRLPALARRVSVSVSVTWFSSTVKGRMSRTLDAARGTKQKFAKRKGMEMLWIRDCAASSPRHPWPRRVRYLHSALCQDTMYRDLKIRCHCCPLAISVLTRRYYWTIVWYLVIHRARAFLQL